MRSTIVAIILSLAAAQPALAAPAVGGAVHAPQGAAPGSYEDWRAEHQVPESLDTRCNSGHAPKGAVPGSYEDWRGEHQVPESLDNRCNPALVPAFKATKDWCAEHGLPESQCLRHGSPGVDLDGHCLHHENRPHPHQG